jgi:hypothetical protein
MWLSLKLSILQNEEMVITAIDWCVYTLLIEERHELLKISLLKECWSWKTYPEKCASGNDKYTNSQYERY